MHELVLVLSDLYLPPELSQGDSSALPGLEQVARFGSRSKLSNGWRPWLARRFIGEELGAPATVAALALSAPQVSTASSGPSESRAVMVWMATPVHMVAGLSTVHVDRRSVLSLDATESAALAIEFQATFHDSGFVLEPLDTGDFLLFGPELPIADELEPARLMDGSVAEAQHGRASDPKLRRLSAEIEMWLHEHPINHARTRSRKPPVTGLWLWGGGRTPARRNSSSASPSDPSSDMAFGHDAYLQGLWASLGRKVLAVPQHVTDIFSYPQAQRAALVINIGSMLHSAPTWSLFDALTNIDRAFISPAVQTLGTRLDRLVLVANDRQLTLRSRDRMKLWRRTPGGLSGLQ